MEDIKKLALCSEMARRYGSNYELIEISDNYGCKIDDGLTFHPNGKCGCILSNDDYTFGIRCDHLMWAEGCCEGTESFWTENDHKIAEKKLEQNNYDDTYNAILIYGNHKGYLLTNLLVFHEK